MMPDSLQERDKSADMLTPMASQLACMWTKIWPGTIYAALLNYRKMSRFGWLMIPCGKRKCDHIGHYRCHLERNLGASTIHSFRNAFPSAVTTIMNCLKCFV